MRYLEYWGCPGTSWEDLQVKHPKWHIGRLPNGICEVVGTAILWWAQSPGSCASSFSQPLSHVNHLSILCRARKKWAFWAASYMASLGKPGTHLVHFNCHREKKSQVKGFSLGAELWWEGRCGQNKAVLTLFNAFMLRYFCPVVCWNISTGLLDSYKVALIHG